MRFRKISGALFRLAAIPCHPRMTRSLLCTTKLVTSVQSTKSEYKACAKLATDFGRQTRTRQGASVVRISLQKQWRPVSESETICHSFENFRNSPRCYSHYDIVLDIVSHARACIMHPCAALHGIHLRRKTRNELIEVKIAEHPRTPVGLDEYGEWKVSNSRIIIATRRSARKSTGRSAPHRSRKTRALILETTRRRLLSRLLSRLRDSAKLTPDVDRGREKSLENLARARGRIIRGRWRLAGSWTLGGDALRPKIRSLCRIDDQK